WLHQARFSPDGRRLLTFATDVGSSHSDAWIWDLATRKITVGPLRHQFRSPVTAHCTHLVAWSPDGRQVATAANTNDLGGPVPVDCEARVGKAQAGVPLAPVVPLDFGVASLEFSPDGRFLATAVWGGPNWVRGRSGEARLLVASPREDRIPPIRTP